MNGNKPLDSSSAEFAEWSPFTARLAAHPRVAFIPYPDHGPDHDEALLVMMVVDEILVGPTAAADPAVQSALSNLGAPAGHVFDERNTPEGQNIAIWRLDSTLGDQDYPDVAEAVWEVRGVFEGKPEEVTPNHVLIPAANYHTCPWSPPNPSDPAPLDLEPHDPLVTVTVIDSGYQAASPIASWVDVTRGKWFARQAAGNYAWVAEPVDPLDYDLNGRLDALVGHANFVAGVVAQRCPLATIKVVSHNGAFVDSDDSDWPIPTEASVARSLWESRSSDVINVGFAFPTLPTVRPGRDGVLADSPASWALDVVLKQMPKEHVIVAPAGNQHSMTPQYPAAFHHDYPNVIGVGSVTSAGERSRFSNHGPWVACCTTGENVISTFINGDRLWETEDAEPPDYPDALTHPTKNFGSGWASWSGTSFAAPKIAGAIACKKVAEHVTPLEAWDKLLETAEAPTPELDMGVLIRDRPVEAV